MMTRTRTAPSGYEKVRLWFHLIRTFQFFASLIVGGIVIDFAYWLRHDDIGIPWTFTILMLTTFITIILLAVTIVFHCLTGLAPRVNLACNSLMMLGWALGFSMLGYWAWGTVWGACTVDNWGVNKGVEVCRAYKALFSFGLLGVVSTAFALGLDIHIVRLQARFGTHVRLDHDQKAHNARSVLDLRNSPYDNHDAAHSNLSLDQYPTRNSDAFEVPHAGFGAKPGHGVSTQGADGKALLTVEGYARPDSPTRGDTGYHGGHHERVYGNGPRSPV